MHLLKAFSLMPRYLVFALLSVLAWSTIGTAMKLTVEQTDIISLLVISVSTALLILLTFIIITKKVDQIIPKNKSEWLYSIVSGVLNPTAYYLILLNAYNLLPAQEAGTLNYFWPFILVILSIPVLKQTPGWHGIIGIFIGFSGLVVISTHGDPTSFRFSNTTGVILAISSAFIWATFWLINMKDKRDDIIKLFNSFLIALIILLIAFFIAPSSQELTPKSLLGGIYLGTFEMGITFIFWLKALKEAPNTATVSNLVFLSPFISLIIISIVLKETILLSTISGLALIVLGILFSNFRRKLPKNISQ
ncbi:MAG TPA: DMT family transporter [Bacteroidales bacterium]|nr:DMT family transporter [Bacteroidales bacterium]